MLSKRFKAARFTLGLLGMLTVVVGASTLFFHRIEGWSYLDAYFFTMVTISTVGYGSLVPVTAAGKIGTTVLIVFGIGLFALGIDRLTHRLAERRQDNAADGDTK